MAEKRRKPPFRSYHKTSPLDRVGNRHGRRSEGFCRVRFIFLLPRYPRFLGAGLHLSYLSHFRGPAQPTWSTANGSTDCTAKNA
jgi:hypothetical protein